MSRPASRKRALVEQGLLALGRGRGRVAAILTAFAALTAALVITNEAAAPVAPSAASARAILLKGTFAITGRVVQTDLEFTAVGDPYDRTWTFEPDPGCRQACTPIVTENRRPDGRVTEFPVFRAALDGSEYQALVKVTGGATCRHNGKVIFKMTKGWTGQAHFRIFVTKSKIIGTKTPVRLATRLEGNLLINGTTTEQFDKACGKRGPPLGYKIEFTGVRKP